MVRDLAMDETMISRAGVSTHSWREPLQMEALFFATISATEFCYQVTHVLSGRMRIEGARVRRRRAFGATRSELPLSAFLSSARRRAGPRIRRGALGRQARLHDLEAGQRLLRLAQAQEARGRPSLEAAPAQWGTGLRLPPHRAPVAGGPLHGGAPDGVHLSALPGSREGERADAGREVAVGHPLGALQWGGTVVGAAGARGADRARGRGGGSLRAAAAL